MDLNSLAKTLAERLLDEFYGECEYSADRWTCDKCSPSLKQAEAVIREAIDKTLEESIRKIRAFDKDDVSSDRGIGYDECIDAIRSLKQQS